MKIAYTVSFSEPQAHYADVEMDISGLKQNILDIKMPVWDTGLLPGKGIFKKCGIVQCCYRR